MTWLPLALLAAVMQSLIAITDKVVVEHYLRDRWSFPFFTAAFLGLYATSLLLVRSYLGLFQMPPAPVLAIALLPGVLHYAASLFYTRALLRTDVSTVAALSQVTPLYALLWGWLFFGDVFGALSYLGIVVIVLCCALLSMEQVPGANRLRFDPALWLVMGGAVLRSLSDLFVKLTLGGQDYWNTFGLSRAALLPISALILFHPGYRRLLVHSLHVNGLRLLPGMALLEALAMLPLLLGVAAYARGPLALVSTIVYTTPLFVLVVMVLLNTLRPGFVPERPAQSSLLHRVVLTIGVLCGVIMLRS